MYHTKEAAQRVLSAKTRRSPDGLLENDSIVRPALKNKISCRKSGCHPKVTGVQLSIVGRRVLCRGLLDSHKATGLERG